MTTQELFQELEGRLAAKGAAQLANSHGIYQFELTGDDGGAYAVSVSNDGAKVIDGTDPNASVTITMAAEDFKALAQGALNPMAAFMSGKLSVTGDMSLALKLQSLIS